MEAVLTTRAESTAAGADGGLAELVGRASRGDERAWEDLVRIYGRRIFALAQSRLRRPDLAEEVTQSVFVTVATKLREESYTEVGRFESWLFRVAMNRVRDAARRIKRQASVMEPGVMEAMPGGTAVEVDREGLDALRRAMETLSDSDREVVELRHHGQMGFKEIAALLGEPVGTVLARHHRALKKLRGVLEPGGPEEERES
jgi:RNA polymerase sigma-70 factor (ECF subfamily)